MSQSKFEEALLRQARSDRPGPAARKAAKAALLASAGLAATATTTSTAAAATVKGASAAASTSGLTTTAAVKLAIAIAIGSGGVAAVVAVHEHTREPSLPPAEVRTTAPTARPALPASVTTIEVPVEAPVASPSELPAAATSVPAPPPPQAKPAKPIAVEDGVMAEARLLEDARTCLARSDVMCTERHLVEHAKRFGARGALAEEAGVLGIDAAKKSGDPALVVARANAFLTEHPTSSYAARVRAALASLEDQRRENDR